METTTWQWDEESTINCDFRDRAEVAAYDARHGKMRNVEGENEAAMEGLGIGPGDVVADFGCGTGAFARRAARSSRRVHAIDLSEAMLEYVRWRAAEEGLENVVCRRGGFLGYRHEGEPFDALHTSLALHHLPDFWKAKALANLASAIRPGGRMHLMDVVFEERNLDANVDGWIGRMEGLGGAAAGESIRLHVAKEYSTLAWIQEGLLERAGFRIDRAEYSGGVLANYYCTRLQKNSV